MLCRQGRMHPGVASFPNREFLCRKVRSTGFAASVGECRCSGSVYSFGAGIRKVFRGKTNRNEARIVAQLAADVYHLYKETFEVNRTLGVITPYRSQIALIRKEIQALGISALNEISVDTVERYQGSERDVIIYSFLCELSLSVEVLA